MRGKARARKFLRLGLVATTLLVGPACAPNPVDRFGHLARANAGHTGGAGGESLGTSAGGNSGAPGMSEPMGGAMAPGSVTPPTMPTIALPDAKPEMPFDGGICGAEGHLIERVRAEMVIVLDRSESMLLTPAGATHSHWTELTGALFELLGTTNGRIRWGFKAYPTSAECTVGPNVEVEITDSSAPVAAAIAVTPPIRGNGTPTAGGIKTATAYLQTRTTPNPKYIVLATEGKPTCTIANGPTRSVEAATAARAAGIPVYVVGIDTGDAAANTALNAIAEAGGVPRAGDIKYYPVANRADLISVFTDITKQVTTCKFPLTNDPPAPDNMFIVIDGTQVARDPSHANGWDYDPATKTVELHGNACSGLKNTAAQSVQVVFGCKLPNIN
jgi:hypothetical protein